MRLEVRIAQTRAEILSCQQLIAETYSREYEVVFSDDHYDLEAKIEPWPHRYVMGLVDGEHVAACGLYLRDTYVERFGQVSDSEIQALLDAGGAGGRFSASNKRELTKLVVARRFRGTGLGRHFLAAAHARGFLQLDADTPHLLVICARRSIWEHLHDRLGIRTRFIKPFPLYKIHELYRSATDPMDSRLIIPDVDIPACWYDLALPAVLNLAQVQVC
jgi:hypothetical protein